LQDLVAKLKQQQVDGLQEQAEQVQEVGEQVLGQVACLEGVVETELAGMRSKMQQMHKLLLEQLQQLRMQAGNQQQGDQQQGDQQQEDQQQQGDQQ
jgi:hypothetical protein